MTHVTRHGGTRHWLTAQVSVARQNPHPCGIHPHPSAKQKSFLRTPEQHPPPAYNAAEQNGVSSNQPAGGSESPTKQEVCVVTTQPAPVQPPQPSTAPLKPGGGPYSCAHFGKSCGTIICCPFLCMWTVITYLCSCPGECCYACSDCWCKKEDCCGCLNPCCVSMVGVYTTIGLMVKDVLTCAPCRC